MEPIASKKIPDSALSEFISECEELISRVSSHFALIEKGQMTEETVDSVYRDMHTIKGSAQLFGFKEIGLAAHAMEACLEPVRRLKKSISPAQIQALYQCVDLIEKMVKALQSGEEKHFKPELEIVVPRLIEASLASFGAERPAEKESAPWSISLEAPKKAEPPVNTNTPVAAKEVKIIEPVVEPKNSGVISTMETTNPLSNASEAKSPQVQENSTHAEQKSGDAGTIRVPVALLDKLMVLMGEMVLVRNQVLQYSNQSDDLNFLNLSQRLVLLIEQKYKLEENNSGEKIEVLIACADGNYHDIGIRLLNVWLKQEGIRSFALFPSLPADSVVSAVETFQPKVLGISVALKKQLKEVEKIQTVLQKSKSNPKIMLGGLAIRDTVKVSSKVDFIFNGNNWDSLKKFLNASLNRVSSQETPEKLRCG